VTNTVLPHGSPRFGVGSGDGRVSPRSCQIQKHFSGLVLQLFADYFRSVFFYNHLATCKEYFRSRPYLTCILFWGAGGMGVADLKAIIYLWQMVFSLCKKAHIDTSAETTVLGIWAHIVRLFLLIKCKEYSKFIFIRDLWNKYGKWVLNIIGLKRNNYIFRLTFRICYKLYRFSRF